MTYPNERPEAYVLRRVEAAVVDGEEVLRGHCHAVAASAPEGTETASRFCVYAATGGKLTPSPAFRHGAPTTRSFRVTVSAAQFSAARAAAEAVMESVERGGRLVNGTGPVDSYDPDREVFQRAVVVEIAV